MVLFDKCCCFFGLTTGGVILGWIGAIESFAMIIFSIFGLTKVETIIQNMNATTHNLTFTYLNESTNETGSFTSHIRVHLTDEEIEIAKIGLYAGMIIYLVVNVVTLISSALLITGALQRNRLFVLPWLIAEGVCLVVSVLAALSKIIELFVIPIHILAGIAAVFFILVVTGEDFYIT
jgi:hypothetical protein